MRNKPTHQQTKYIFLAALLFLRGLLGIAYTLSIPLGEAPDEADHYAYAAYIITERRLPTGPEMTQAKHPPLYHIISALAGAVIGGTGESAFLRANPDVGLGPDALSPNFFIHTTLEDWPWRAGVLALHAGRSVSIFAGLVLVLATYLLGRAIWPSRPALAFSGAAFAAFLPESLFIGGAMNNDLLAAMWATLALWLVLSPSRQGLKALLAGLCLGCAFVTKASTGSLAFVIAAAMFAGDYINSARRLLRRKSLARSAVRVTIAGGAAFAVAAPWLGRNWKLHGDLLGWPMVLATIDQRQGSLVVADVLQLFRGWWYSFWGKFGGAGHIPLPVIFYVLWAVLCAGALTGWMMWLWRSRRGIGLVRETALSGWLMLLGTPLVIMAGIYSYSQIALGTDQGRLLFPALGPLGLLIAAGLSAWVPSRSARLFSVAFSGGMALVASAALYAGLVQPFAPPPEPARTDAAQAANVTFGPLQLVAFAWNDPEPGQLTLYWRALQQTSEDLRTALRVFDDGGDLLWEWKRSPGAGRFSTDRWPVNRIVADTYRIPPEVFGRIAAVQIGLRPFPEGPWLPISGLTARQLLTLPR